MPKRRDRCAVFGVPLLGVLLIAGNAQADRPAALSPQTVTRPSGPSSLKGLGESFSPNLATGTGNFSIPLQLPPGILAPEVSIQYTAGKGKGLLGTSFHLPVLNIYRSTDKGLPKFKEDDRFSVEGPTLNDELVLVNADRGWYRLRNEGAFALFERSVDTDSWLVRLPNGHTLRLGESEQGRQRAQGRTVRWFVQRHQDRFGHEIQYSYFPDGGRLYLETIAYQVHAAPQFWNTIVFEYGSRYDRFVDYRYGEAMWTSLRLTGIEMSQGARVLRRYDFSYEEGLVSSLLSNVTMTGENGETLPALSFEYVEPNPRTSYLVSMRDVPALEGFSQGWSTLEDMNGDGLPDVLVGRPGKYEYYENMDGVWFSRAPKSIANSPDRSLADADVILADMDGDGYRDVVSKSWRLSDGFRYFARDPQRVDAFQATRHEKVGYVWQQDGHFGLETVRITDLNHDGRVDLLYTNGATVRKITNQPNDTFLEETIGQLPPDVDLTNSEIRLTEMNGDGILDFVHLKIRPTGNSLRVWYGKGNGYYSQEETISGVPVGTARELFLQDVNNDGQSDIVYWSGTWLTYYLNIGRGGFRPASEGVWGVPSFSRTSKVLFADMNGNGTADMVWLTLDGQFIYLDMLSEPNFGLLKRVDNSMGMVTEIDYRSSTSYAVDAKYEGKPWRTPMPNPVPVISEIRVSDSMDALGLEENVSRTTFTYRDGYFDTKEREFRGFAEATSTSHGDADHESLVTQTYMHVGRNLETGADEEILKGKPWLQLTKDEDGQLYGSVETKWERRWLCQEDIQTTVSQKILPKCNGFSKLEEHKEELVAFAVQTEALTGVWEKTNTPKYTATKAKHNAWGSVIRSENYGEVLIPGGHVAGTPFDLSKMNLPYGNDEQVSETDYLYDVNRWMLGISYASRVMDMSGKFAGQTRTYFDGPAFVGLPLGQVTDGLVTRTSAWLKDSSGERWLDAKRMEYNSDGLVVATKDANNNLVELDYDSDVRMFPVAERFHVDVGPLEFTAQYDLGTGAMTSATDLNGNTTSFSYNGLGRLTSVVDPYGSVSARYSYTYGREDYPISETKIEALVDRDSGRMTTSYSYSDGQGRTRLVKTQAEKELGGWIGSGWSRLSPRGGATQVYDSFTSSFPGFEPAPTFAPFTKSTFDGQGRAMEVTPPATEHVATYTKTQYLPFETRVYDERDSMETPEKRWNYPANTIVDGLGRVRQIVKHNDIDGVFKKLVWNVEYDTAGNIIGFIDPKNNKRQYTYDTLGRMLSVTDPNADHVDYTYDAVGNLLARVDSLGQTQTWEYGAANRLMGAVMTGDPHGRPDYTYEYTYDVPSPLLPGATNLLGKLSGASYPTGTIQFSYDKQDRLTDELQTLWDGTSPYTLQKRDAFAQKFTYNAAGQVTSEEAPGDLRLQFLYNERNLLKDVSGQFGNTFSRMFDGILYDHRGAAVQTDARNGIRSVAWYDNRARLQAVAAGPKDTLSWKQSPLAVNPQALQHLVYHRTPTGLISQIDDLTTAKVGYPRFDASYTYDRLYQLIGANTPNGKLTYTYDEIQNFTKRTALDTKTAILSGAFGYGERGAGPNQITSAGNQTFEYDAVGQMKQYKGFFLTFDVEGRLVKAQRDGGPTLEYHYDDTGARKLTIVKRAGKPDKVVRTVSSRYQIRNGEKMWVVGAGLSQVEIRQTEGLRLDLPLLDELTAYVQNPKGKKKPLIDEYMDLDGDGDGFDAGDLDVAYQAYWKDAPAGGPKKVWKYTLKDQLGGTTHTMDSRGEVVSHQQYFPYGKTAYRDGQKPTYGFAGSEIEEVEELGLVQFGARWYAPEVGRWVSADNYFREDSQKTVVSPLDASGYVYAIGNPINSTDRSGKYDEVTHGALTYHLALASGFSQKDAAKIALNSASVDHDAVTAPVNGANLGEGRTRTYHFAGQQEALNRLGMGISKMLSVGDIEALGMALHSAQDVLFDGPHARGVGAGELWGLGHGFYITEKGNQSAPYNHRTDYLWENPNRNAAQLTKIVTIMGEAARMRNNSTGVAIDWTRVDVLLKKATSITTKDGMDAFLKMTGKDKNGNLLPSYYDVWKENNRNGGQSTGGLTWDNMDANVEPLLEDKVLQRVQGLD
jgi:RHS repeat-associated protein